MGLQVGLNLSPKPSDMVGRFFGLGIGMFQIPVSGFRLKLRCCGEKSEWGGSDTGFGVRGRSRQGALTE